ncbi:MAG: hypothetical protein ABSG43_20700 [Solirubrobacteraceae bacterium]|jgi:hypothetical protein
MHAVVVVTKLNDRSAARAELKDLVSLVSSMPGFVSGSWVAFASEDRGSAMVVFDSEDAAKALATIARQTRGRAVTTESVQVGEVWARV